MTDDTREYTIYVEYDARLMWRDDADKTGQIGPTFTSHDAISLVTDRLNGLRAALHEENYHPSEVSSRSFVVPLADVDVKRIKAGKVSITQDGVEAGSTGIVEPDGKAAKNEGKSPTVEKDAQKGQTKKSDADTPVQAADQSRARDSKKDGPDHGDARRDVEAKNKMTADEAAKLEKEHEKLDRKVTANR